MKADELINKVKYALLEIEPRLQIYLYGSRAKGNFHSDSDWDILVISPEKEITFDYELKLREPILDIEMESGEVISLLLYSKFDWENKKDISPLFSNVLEEGFLVS